MRDVTKIDDEIYQCGDCSEWASKPEKIRHRHDCQVGESRKWKRHYENNGRAPVRKSGGWPRA